MTGSCPPGVGHLATGAGIEVHSIECACPSGICTTRFMTAVPCVAPSVGAAVTETTWAITSTGSFIRMLRNASLNPTAAAV